MATKRKKPTKRKSSAANKGTSTIKKINARAKEIYAKGKKSWIASIKEASKDLKSLGKI